MSEGSMAEGLHPSAPEHLPAFITAPGEPDVLFWAVVVFVVVFVMVLGNLYLRLHSLPEQMAHRANSTQLLVISVLGLLALVTHNNIFWVAALLLAIVKLPDYATPLNTIARALDQRPQPGTNPPDYTAALNAIAHALDQQTQTTAKPRDPENPINTANPQTQKQGGNDV